MVDRLEAVRLEARRPVKTGDWGTSPVREMKLCTKTFRVEVGRTRLTRALLGS